MDDVITFNYHLVRRHFSLLFIVLLINPCRDILDDKLEWVNIAAWHNLLRKCVDRHADRRVRMFSCGGVS